METVGLARLIHELDLEPIRGQDFHHGANLSDTQSQLGQVFSHGNRVQQFDGVVHTRLGFTGRSR
jgi:hypothetical protein